MFGSLMVTEKCFEAGKLLAKVIKMWKCHDFTGGN